MSVLCFPFLSFPVLLYLVTLPSLSLLIPTSMFPLMWDVCMLSGAGQSPFLMNSKIVFYTLFYWCYISLCLWRPDPRPGWLVVAFIFTTGFIIRSGLPYRSVSARLPSASLSQCLPDLPTDICYTQPDLPTDICYTQPTWHCVLPDLGERRRDRKCWFNIIFFIRSGFFFSVFL